MDEHTFDSIVRTFGEGASRRRFVHLIGGSLVGGGIVALAGEGAGAKKRKGKRKKPKACGPCRATRKGTCKEALPDGVACGAGLVCQGGACVAACPEGQACGNGGICRKGQCESSACTPECAAPATCINGRCVCPGAQTCGEVTCCTEDLFCENDYCMCGGDLCSCPASSRVCQGTGYDQCCLNADSCDPELLCVASTCSAANSFCTLQYAYCNGTADCSCAQTVSGQSACVSTVEIGTCPNVGNCESDTDCPAHSVCVNPCCPDGEIRGVCMSECATR